MPRQDNTYFTDAQANAIRQWTLSRITLTVDNASALYRPINEAARTAANLLYPGQDPHAVIGAAVAHRLSDLIASARNATSSYLAAPSLLWMLTDLLDLTDPQMIKLLGQHYHPGEPQGQ